MSCPSKINLVRILLGSSGPLKHMKKNLLKGQERELLVLMACSPSGVCKPIVQFKDSVLQSTA